jgi:hypothetical protein
VKTYHQLLATQSLLALNSASLEVAELLKLVLKTFWSATFMGVPAVLLRPDQFTGWTGCLMELIRRPVPQARPRRPGRVRGPGEGRSARLCARCRSRQRSVASPCAGLRPGAEGEAELRKACGVPQRPRGPQALRMSPWSGGCAGAPAAARKSSPLVQGGLMLGVRLCTPS